MRELIQSDLESQIGALENDYGAEFSLFRDALRRSLRWSREGVREAGPIAIPVVGSGLNNLCAGGIGSWSDLVKEVRKAAGDKTTDYEWERSGLGNTQQLELLLREASKKRDSRARLAGAFERAFGSEVEPSQFHCRLAAEFPILITTNYNNILGAAAPGKRVLDVTDEYQAAIAAALNTPAILHVHGRWHHNAEEEGTNRIFRNVGNHPPSDGACLVISEHQYHKLYRFRDSYRKAIASVFGSENFLFFLGSSLASDETGLHAALIERIVHRRGELAGVYVGLDMLDERTRSLRLRGLLPINLRRMAGYRRAATESLFHALLDLLEQAPSFAPAAAATGAGFPTPPDPEVLCAGIASWNSTISLGSRLPDLSKETAHKVLKRGYHEEPGGQHLSAALHLVRRGHVVALASIVGDDEIGDRILKGIEREVAKSGSDTGDFVSAFIAREGTSRHCITVTFSGTRVIFDSDGEKGQIHPETPIPYSWEFDQLSTPRALYLGTYFLDTQERILRQFPTAPFRFLETGTSGPREPSLYARAVAIAKRCTHVLSSSAFAARLAGKDATARNPREWQDLIFAENQGGSNTIVSGAFRALWPVVGEDGVLVTVMGGNGAMVVSLTPAGTVQCVRVPAYEEAGGEDLSWLGCGDIFRAEFIHSILDGSDIHEAAKHAATAAGKKIKNLSCLRG